MRRRPARFGILVGTSLALVLLAGPTGVGGQRKPAAEQRRAPAKPKERADIAAFRARVEAALAADKVNKAYWGVQVTDAHTGEVLYALNAEKYFTPASNTKLFTTALAMATLGPEYRFRTTIETRGALDASGRLRGDLVLVGRGDANLSNRKFPFAKEVERDGPPEKVLAELADALVARGVKQIEGDIVADDSYFAYDRFPSGWTVDDLQWGYGAAVSAICVNDNTFTLEVRPGEHEGDAVSFGIEPWADFYSVRNEALTSAAGSERKLEVTREPGSRTIRLGGTIAARSDPARLTLAVEEPAEYAAALLRRLLEARGLRIYGETRARHTPAPAAAGEAPTVLAEHLSVALLEDVRFLNKISQNLHAELLLRAAAREKGGAVKLDDALKFRDDFLKSIGIEEGEAVLHDGSGLSRRNLVTPVAEVKLLTWIAQQPWADAFRATLPVAGDDGTLSERMKNTAAAGKIQAKTGSFDHVQALAGYATTAKGAELVFSMFANQHNLRGREASGVLDAICVAMIEEIRSAPPAPPKKEKRK